MLNIKHIKRLLAGLAISATAMSGAHAASSGDFGSTSTGTLNLQMDVVDTVLISGLTSVNVDFGSWDTVSDLSQTFTACVFHTTSTYNLTAVSQHVGATATTTFAMSPSSSTAEVNYDVALTGTADAGFTERNLDNNVQETGLLGDTVNDDCSGAPNTTFRVDVPAANLSGKELGTYVDTLELIVSVP